MSPPHAALPSLATPADTALSAHGAAHAKPACAPRAFACALFAAVAASVVAAEEATPAAKITACLAELDIVARDVEASPITGLYEVEAEGGNYLHVAGVDCRHLIVGDLWEKRGDQVISLTGAKRTAKQRKRLRDALAEVPASEMIVFKPADDARAVVSVFTDTDCGYCRKLHAAMDDYHALGIEVRYLAFPRAGVNSGTYDKMVSAWCADDPKAALTALKRGEGIPSRTCAHPVGKQHAIAQEVGLTGTPALVLEDGTLLPGFLEANALAEQIGL